MAEGFIEEIYGYAHTISRLREVVERFRYAEDYQGTELFRKRIPDMGHLLDACLEDGYEEAELLRDGLYSIKNINDMIAVADLLEGSVIPIMERWIQSWVSVDEQVDARYRIESTSGGFLTIKDMHSNRYLHSNSDPMDEARKLVETQFDYEKESYRVWGCGMGYHVYQLFLISEGTIPITVYEPNPNLIRYALQYGVLSWIPHEKLEIIPGCNVAEFTDRSDPAEGVLFLYPYIDAMQNAEQKSRMMEYYSCHANITADKLKGQS